MTPQLCWTRVPDATSDSGYAYVCNLGACRYTVKREDATYAVVVRRHSEVIRSTGNLRTLAAAKTRAARYASDIARGLL